MYLLSENIFRRRRKEAMASASFAREWFTLSERLKAATERSRAELEECWRELNDLLERQFRESEMLATSLGEPRDLQAWRIEREKIARRLLQEPCSQWERLQLARRAMMAIEMYDRDVGAALGALPEAISLTTSEILSALEPDRPQRWWQRITILKRARRPRPLRALVEAELRRQRRRRLDIEGQYFLLLAETTRALRDPWDVIRAAVDAAAAGHPLASREVKMRLQRIQTARQELIERGQAILSAWRAWGEAMESRLKKRLVSGTIRRRRPRPLDGDEQWAAYRIHWTRQMRAAEMGIRLERNLEQAEDRLLELFQKALENLAVERAGLEAEFDEAIEWLRQRIERQARGDFPPPRMDVVPAASRVSELDAELKAALGSLPSSYEIWTTFSPSPRRRLRAKQLRPRDVLSQTLRRRGWGEIMVALQDIEAKHRDILQQIERAREVVRFGLEVADSALEADTPIARDALRNALSLLEHQRRQRSDEHAAASVHLMRTLASVLLEARMLLARHQLSALAYLAQQGLRQAVVLLGRSSLVALTQSLRRLVSALERFASTFLITIGWKPAPSADRSEVITRPFLPEEFTLDLGAQALPALYRHLFRLEPVQDPRFLVGREQELAAIAEARSLWEAGRPVAILIVGQRGSGKTSLINGALKRSLAGLEIVRGEFRDRLVTESQMREFLARCIGAENVSSLEDFLAASRRVVIIEELERTFLRQIGYYGAIRSLQRVIAATCPSTLWILTLNEVAFRFLNAAVNLGARFSHRLNISTASREDLRQAILRRHDLSGLRLQFPPSPRPRALADRIKTFLRGPADPEMVFFEALARESAGVYRTALELWLGHIEAIEAGVLYLKPIVTPDLSPVIEDLDLEDLFTLVAILQHGSLTPEEHAIVFQRSIAASRAQLDELLAREIIEPDPNRPGFRVRPEASRVVREALYRRNLL